MAFPLNVAIASAVRTPIARAVKGVLRDTRPDDLAAIAVAEALARVEGLSGADVDDVVLGCAMPEGAQGLNIARNVALLAGLPDSVGGETINRFCSSGLQAIAHGAQSVQTGSQQVVVAGGVESMSQVPMSTARVSLNPEIVNKHPEIYISMGNTAENVARKFDVSREAQDKFALWSHHKAVAAIKGGRFKDEIVTVKARRFEGGEVHEVNFDTDEGPRADTTFEALSGLKPVFAAKDGSVTAGNSSPLNDGAAAVVLLSDAKMQELGLKPLGRIRAFTIAGVPPEIMGIGPVPAIQKLLKLVGMTIDDIDRFEINEAFASQAIYTQRELKIPDDKLNVNGGGIAIGHPLGCTGARLTTSLLYELKRSGGKFGIVSMCVGGGMGAAGLFELN
ncbi:MAG: thiolase family protein [Clostridia bacterium]|nr:thiolase family protein [Deltaproteobacteria bacterium]